MEANLLIGGLVPQLQPAIWAAYAWGELQIDDGERPIRMQNSDGTGIEAKDDLVLIALGNLHRALGSVKGMTSVLPGRRA